MNKERERMRSKAFAVSALVMLFLITLFHDVHASVPASINRSENASLAALPVGSTAAASDLLGTWTVNRVKVKKTVNGVSSEKTYSAGQKVEAFIPCPQRWRVINNKDLEMYFEDGRKEVLQYELGNGQFSINSLGAIFDYSYSVNNGTMTLTSAFKYGDNEEEYLVVDLKKQN